MREGDAAVERCCAKCNAPKAPLLCQQCRDAAWCSVECQKQDWLAHKGSCRERVLTAQEKKGWDAPAPLPAPAPVFVDLDQAWHPLPALRTTWEQGPEEDDAALPLRREVPDGDPGWLAAVSPADEGERRRVQGRVSVIVPTLRERAQFHAQLWLCYHAQTHADKELVVVDSGDTPSPFFRECTAAGVTYVHTTEVLSVGEKRNLAIREHSTGEIIANFDDDDLYFPAYLSTMVRALKASKAALVHLSAWNVLDVETGLCATFDPPKASQPGLADAAAWSDLCGFCMVYTHAAWRCVPWPALTVGEDRCLLRAFREAGLPCASRSEAGRAMTVLHVQHGQNMGQSVCHAARKDTAAITAMVERFEEACRRIIKLPMAEYDQLGASLLYHRLFGVELTAEPPRQPKGLRLLPPVAADDPVAAQAEAVALEAWRRSGAGLRPDREAVLREQRERPRRAEAQ